MNRPCSLAQSGFSILGAGGILRPSIMQILKFQSAVKRHWQKINLRAVAALLFFLLSWLAPSAALWEQPLDYCSMECCVAEGHCCCASQKLWVEGQDHSGVREIGHAEIESSCPCPATPAISAKVFSRRISPTIRHEPAANQPSPLIEHRQSSGYNLLRFSPTSPRAPPASFLHA